MNVTLSYQDYTELHDAKAERDKLLALINSPELIDFPRAVMMEAAHQELRWGTADRQGKKPHDWHWLLAHLAGRALEHHEEAERLTQELDSLPPDDAFRTALLRIINRHREKATHHCVTSAAMLCHWHKMALGKFTAMRPGADAAAVDSLARVG